MGFFSLDTLTELNLQKRASAFLKSVTNAAITANPATAGLVAAISSVHPHLTPGITLSLAQGGFGPYDDVTNQVSNLAAQRRIQDGIGWNQIGDRVNPTSAGLLSIPGIHFPEAVANTLDNAFGGIKWTVDNAYDQLTGALKPTLRTTGAIAISGGQLADAAVRRVMTNSPDNSLKNELLETDIGQAAASLFSGHGLGLGSGYVPGGPSSAAAAAASAQTQSLTYADHPYFSLHGEDTPTPHTATFGRDVAKTVIQPGSSMFSLVSGLLDAGKQIILDPLSAAGKALGEANEARRLFSPEDLGASTPAATAPRTYGELIGREKSATRPFDVLDEQLHPHTVGLLDGSRPDIHPPTTQTWLDTSPVGRAVVDHLATNSSPYDIFQRLGGMKGNITPELANDLALAPDANTVRGILSNQLGLDLSQKPPLTATLPQFTNRLDGIRFLQRMPNLNFTDLEDSSGAAKQLILNLRNAKAPAATIESRFNQLAAATTAAERGDILWNASMDIAEHVASTDLNSPLSSDSLFSRLRGAYPADETAWKAITNQQIANKAPISGVFANGEELRLASPYLDAEAADKYFAWPDIRTIRQLSSTYGRLMALSHLDVPVTLLDHLQDLWRGTSIARISTSLRIIGQSQIQMAARGLDNIYTHPLDLVAESMGRKLGTDIVGNAFEKAASTRAFRDGSNAAAGNWSTNVKQAVRDIFHPGDDGYINALASDIHDLHVDEVAQRLASGGVDEAERWLRSSEGKAYRDTRALTDDEITPYVLNVKNRIISKTLGQDSLINAIATGEHLPGSPAFSIDADGNHIIHPGFKVHLNALAKNGLTPDETIGAITAPYKAADASGILDRTVNRLFSTLLSRPINYFVSDPAFRQYYYQGLAQSLPHMTEEAQTLALRAAKEAGVDDKAIKSLAKVASQRSGQLTLEEGDMLTKSHALQSVRDTLYDQYSRRQGLDITRLLFPFGQAWGQQLKEWSSLIADRPNIIPRAETLVHGAQGSGFFYKDPQTGEESFAYPWSTGIMKIATGVPFRLTAPVSSLNMFSSNPLMPGFGPVAQVALGHIIPDKPKYDDLRKAISPFGSRGDLNSFVPSWLSKIKTGFDAPQDNSAFANTVLDVARYLQSTGAYDLSTVDGQQRLEDQARDMARKVYIFRGIGQFTLPAAPSPEDIVKDINGNATLTFAMTKEYQRLRDEDQAAHTNLAVSRFIDEFGVKNILGMQSATKGNIPPSQAPYDWMRTHPDLARDYPDIYPYFAPSDNGFSPQAYQALFQNGQRKTLTVKEALDAANQRVAQMIYSNAKDKVGPKPSADQSAWLRTVKDLLIHKYPGYNPDTIVSNVPDEIRQLETAANDPRLANNPVTRAVQAYLQARDMASKSSGLVTWNTAPSATPTRAWLRDVASRLIAKVPEFQNVYDSLLSHELKDDS